MIQAIDLAGFTSEFEGVLIKTVDNVDIAQVQKFMDRLHERFNKSNGTILSQRGRPDRATFRFFDGTAVLVTIDQGRCFVVVDAGEESIKSRVRIYAQTGLSTNKIDSSVHYVYLEADGTIIKGKSWLSKEVDNNPLVRHITTEAEYIDMIGNWGNTGVGFPDLAETELPGFGVLGTAGYEENDCIYFHWKG